LHSWHTFFSKSISIGEIDADYSDKENQAEYLAFFERHDKKEKQKGINGQAETNP